MDRDLMLVVGTLILALAFPAVVSAFSESRPPRMAAIFFIVGGGLLAYTLSTTPGGAGFDSIPKAFATVIGRYIH